MLLLEKLMNTRIFTLLASLLMTLPTLAQASTSANVRRAEPPTFPIEPGPPALPLHDGVAVLPMQRTIVWFVAGKYWTGQKGHWYSTEKRTGPWQEAANLDVPDVLASLTDADIAAAQVRIARANRIAHWDRPVKYTPVKLNVVAHPQAAKRTMKPVSPDDDEFDEAERARWQKAVHRTMSQDKSVTAEQKQGR